MPLNKEEPAAKAETALDCSRTPLVFAPTDLTPAVSDPDSDWTGDTMEASERQKSLAQGIRPGDRVGRFTIDERLGEGGMGVVYLATDSDLQRKVAIKFIHLSANPERSSQGAKRLLREAQATAALSHRNVVTVHEVGMHQGEPYVAMEYLEGLTLRSWIDAKARSWQEILPVFIQAAKGLSAAHDAGIVHRDFKPENVMVCGERVCVVDFGLARSSSSADEPNPASSYESPEVLAGLAEQLTHPGTLLGTPRYMSPEQRQRVTVGAKSDQYSFCVSMFEAVYGVVPSSDEDAKIGASQKLHEVLLRGLKEAPEERYLGMAELIDDLEGLLPTTNRSRIAWIASVAFLLTVLGVAVIVAGFNSTSPPCDGAEERVAEVWGAKERGQIAQSFSRIAGDFGRQQSEHLNARLDEYAHSWSGRHVSTCRATRVEHRQSDTMHDLRMECLERKLDELRVVTSTLASASELKSVRNAQQVTLLLSPLEECDDTAALREAQPLPSDVKQRQHVQSLLHQVREINALRRFGRYKESLTFARTVVADARETNYTPLLAVAMLALGTAELDVGDSRAAEATFTETTKIAAQARDDKTAAEAWSRLVQVIGSDESAPSRAVPLFPAAEAAVVRAGSSPLLEVGLHYHIAVVLDIVNKSDEAIARLQQAEAILQPLLEADASAAVRARYADVLFEMGGVKSRRGSEDEGIELTQRAIEIWKDVYGANHPELAFGYNNLAEAYRHKGQLELALQHHQTALGIRLASFGAGTSQVADSLLALANVEDGLSRYEDALEHLGEALAIQQKVLPANSIQIAKAKLTIATSYKSLKRYDEAGASYDEAIEIFKSHVDTDLNLGIAYYNRGELKAQTESYRKALKDYALAIQDMQSHLGAEHMYLIYPLLGQGTAQVRLENYSAAIVPLERALTLQQAGGADHEIVSCKLYLGIALYRLGRSRRRAIDLVETARTELVAFGAAAASEVEEAERFLSEHASH